MILQGDALTVLRTLPGESVQMAITSLPYWNLRDYHMAGQLGLEQSYEDYVSKLCAVFDEVKRVLRNDGTCWVNLADTYSGSSGAPHHRSIAKRTGSVSPFPKLLAPIFRKVSLPDSFPLSHPDVL